MHIKLFNAALVLILFSGIYFTHDTNASYSDVEISNTNSVSASSLDMNIQGTGFTMTAVKPGDTQEKTLVITNDGSQDFTYRVRVDKLGGTPALCDAITLDVKHGAANVYTGSLTGFTGDPTTFSAGSNTWIFKVGFTSDNTALMSKSCTFSLTANAWQTGTSGLTGFSDYERIDNSIQTNTWVIVSFTKNVDTHTISFSATNIEDYTLLHYKITYTSNDLDKGIEGTHGLSGDHSYQKNDQFLGSCTSGGTCTPDPDIADLKLIIDLTDSGGVIHSFEKTL